MQRMHVATAVAAIMQAFVATPAAAQQETEARSVLEGVYTAEQASQGEDIYNQECALCHGLSEFGTSAFLRIWNNRTVDALFNLISSTMPQDAPGRLDPEEYAAVISYFFELNGLPEGEEELPADVESLQRIQIESDPDTES